MKYIFTTLLVLLAATNFAQTPQIARVSSDGTTTVIYTDIKKALAAAQDDDFIYLPAGTFKVDSVIIQKRVNVVGTGIYPDSTKATGKTVINSIVYLKAGRDGGSLQGVEFSTSGGGSIAIYDAGNFTISKCMFNKIYDYDATASGTITIKECIVNGSFSNSTSSSNGNLVYNVSNSIIADEGAYYSIFSNCIFTNFTNLYGLYSTSNKEFRNCIFRTSSSSVFASSDRFYNCHFENVTANGFRDTPPQFNTTYDAPSGSTFVGGACPAAFSYTFDYHLKSGTAAIGSGTDGMDKGIYGSMNPYNPNPYNPHIYFKNIAPATNAQGQLQINVKVKAQ